MSTLAATTREITSLKSGVVLALKFNKINYEPETSSLYGMSIIERLRMLQFQGSCGTLI